MARRSIVLFVSMGVFLAFSPEAARAADDLISNIFGSVEGEKATGAPSASERSPRQGAPRVRSPKPLNKGIENRIKPSRRSGKEGAAEAKLDNEQARELYIRRKARLEEIKARQGELSRDKRTLANNRARLQARLVETARSLKLSEKRLSDLETRLAETREKMKEQQTKLDAKSQQLSALFSLMQGLSRQPPPLLITHTRDALKMIRSGMVLATFYADVEKLATQLTVDVDALEAIEKDVALQEQRRRIEQAQNFRIKAQLDLLIAENREQIQANAATLESLGSASKINIASIKSLEDMLPAISASKAEADSKSNEFKPDATRVALQAGLMKPSIPFAAAQGLLPMPVQGKALVNFGQTTEDGSPSKGIHLESRPGAQVISPCDGQVLFAGPFRSYGQLLIIDAGGGYHVVIAGMERIEVEQGQFVLAGEPLAAMESEPRADGTTPKRPSLYVEFRREQQSVDPAPWWSAGGKG
ncbi:peptidoglycan DD-metalloendopeptidase family protein [Rhodomicrobium vannielii ATCC 17100]|uniref:murein hydrolase activator EnvC family protein n=1 Tax=Rhodomicrobium vannielii TaxID=1069 RepID=UPI00191B336D|nr:peptidoglycan DD-metalloendopeptidase family protein [Rhodomicrobium vannielii]MBJ7534094.1 peptidoglycan DD-metalloendopeptidase family protein [Rhodomicrobium vannielii ATCC 17100]